MTLDSRLDGRWTGRAGTDGRDGTGRDGAGRDGAGQGYPAASVMWYDGWQVSSWEPVFGSAVVGFVREQV